MNRIATTALALALIAGAAAVALAADDFTVDQIVDNALRVSYYQGATGRADVKMTITDSQERTRERELTILRRAVPAPAVMRTQRFLTLGSATRKTFLSNDMHTRHATHRNAGRSGSATPGTSPLQTPIERHPS